MSTLETAQVTLPKARPGEVRVADLLGREVTKIKPPRAIIVGFPCDQGVERNGGRIGAAKGPPAIREYLYRLTPDPGHYEKFCDLLRHTQDIGDVVIKGSMEDNQTALAQVLEPYFKAGTFVVVLGGGHETSFGHFLGYEKIGKKVSILNWDAHPDVRPFTEGQGHSGSPFRQALEHHSGLCAGYQVAGLLAHALSREHLTYLDQKGSRYYWRHELAYETVIKIFDGLSAPAFVSYDLDALDQSLAPGVSAPTCGGLTQEVWLRAAFEGGKSAKVSSVDIVELNPLLDRDGQTARLAALTVWHILKGLLFRVS